MSIPKKILNHLEKNKVKYDIIAHKTVYTAFDLANTTKSKLSDIAKTLLVKADSRYVLVVVPAHYRLDLAKVKKALKAKKIQIANELVMKKTFKVKPGAITPFGTVHKAEVVIDNALKKTNNVIIGAGSFVESLRMKVKDLAESEEAKFAALGTRASAPGVPKTPKPKKSPLKSKAKKQTHAKKRTR